MVAAIGLAASVAGPASALDVRSVPIDGARGITDDPFPRDLAANPDGSVRVLLEQWGRAASQRQVTFTPEGTASEPLQLLAPSPLNGTFTLGGLSASGAVVTYRSERRPHPKLRGVVWEDGRQVGKARTISDPAHSFRGGWTNVAPNGAAATDFWQHLGGGRWEERIAVRPAGAPNFLPAVAASPTDRPLQVRRIDGVSSETYWGPNGDGIVFWAGGAPGEDGSVLRRISRDGQLGPAITIPSTDFPIDASSAIAIGADSTILIVRVQTREGDWVAHDDGDGQIITTRAEVLTVRAGSDVASEPVELSTARGWNDDVRPFTVGAALRPDGSAIVGLGSKDHLELFEGDPAGQLRSVASFATEQPGYGPLDIVPTSDGGAAAFWGAQTLTSQRDPSGRWSTPELLLPRLKTGISVIEEPRALPDGGIAAIVRRDAEDDALDAGLIGRVVFIHR